MPAYWEVKESVEWICHIVKEYNGVLPTDPDFLFSFKYVLDIAYNEFLNEDDFRKSLGELKIKNIDSLVSKMTALGFITYT